MSEPGQDHILLPFMTSIANEGCSRQLRRYKRSSRPELFSMGLYSFSQVAPDRPGRVQRRTSYTTKHFCGHDTHRKTVQFAHHTQHGGLVLACLLASADELRLALWPRSTHQVWMHLFDCIHSGRLSLTDGANEAFSCKPRLMPMGNRLSISRAQLQM